MYWLHDLFEIFNHNSNNWSVQLNKIRANNISIKYLQI